MDPESDRIIVVDLEEINDGYLTTQVGAKPYTLHLAKDSAMDNLYFNSPLTIFKSPFDPPNSREPPFKIKHLNLDLPEMKCECGRNIYKEEYEAHWKFYCPHRLTLCQKCGAWIQKEVFEEHHPTCNEDDWWKN